MLTDVGCLGSLRAAVMGPLARMTALESAGFIGREGRLIQRETKASLGIRSKLFCSSNLSRTSARFSTERT